jgi:hypothetical protein
MVNVIIGPSRVFFGQNLRKPVVLTDKDEYQVEKLMLVVCSFRP